MYGVLTNMVSIAGCVVMAASRRFQQECSRPKTDGDTAVLVRFLRVAKSHGGEFFLARSCPDVDGKKF